MLSKLLRPGNRSHQWLLVYNKSRLIASHQVVCIRPIFGLIPPSQYDMPFPKKFKLGYVMKVYWETIPLFVTTAIALGVVFIAIVWACNHKVDVVFTSRSRGNISRTMDLRNPSIHKMLTINQRYEPWNEMQDVLDKMVTAEKRALVRSQSCNNT
ncbi:uncharacterized protein LOC113510902 [Galleria mellonella]|uniref:Uncharacterized protein LOC113510902 n=1 Tax=Galleria mellonella TaxID=7137 RepID=A0A6J3CB22_GALME|nr:uncharacterized protein LOC113510902 [Galleria mellonella]